jgi:exodeoxyribonuclease VIII
METLPIARLERPQANGAVGQPSVLLQGIFPGTSDEVYRRAKGIPQSTLKEMQISPAHYRTACQAGPHEPTPDMILGSAFHCQVLQPELFSKFFTARPDGLDMRSKNGRNWKSEASGLGILSREDMAAVDGMAAAVLSHPLARAAIDCSLHEVAAFAPIVLGRRTLQRKGLVDLLPTEGSALADLKTVPYGGATPEAWSKKLVEFYYHLQSAYYLDICNQAADTLQWTQFVHIVVEKKPPFAVAVYLLDQEAIEAGRDLYYRLLARVAECEETGRWPSYSQELLTANLPRWAKPRVADADLF